MNYRHSYHAGNFADVFKHVLLITLVQSLLRKNKPFCYLDTHAGISSYDLQAASAQKTQEFESGISKLWKTSNTLPAIMVFYIELIRAWNSEKGSSELRYYPGSPSLVRKLLRPDDRMILTELHPEDAALLKQGFLHDKQAAVHHLNGYHALKAFLPPKEARGLVLIDPPFENGDEFTHIIKQLQTAMRRWESGIYAIWYPIKDATQIAHFCQNLQASGIRKILRCEISLPYLGSTSLQACGMMIVHPPWQWKEQVEEILPVLSNLLSSPGKGGYKLEWLMPE